MSENAVREKSANALQYAYRLVILNDCDAPETRMIALVRDAGEGPEWTYLSADRRFDGKWLKWNKLSHPKDTTEISQFGVKPIIELRDGQHEIRVERVRKTRARYPDGVAREWQGHIGARSVVRRELLPEIKCWSAQSP